MFKFIKNFFFKLGLKDSPSKLKKHTQDVPLVGGILFIIVLIVSSLFITFDFYSNTYLLFIFLLIGIWDDIKNLNPNFKFLITLIFLLSIIYYDSNLQIKLINFKHLQDIYIPNNKYLNILIPAICLMLLLNAYNMSDGINGLASIIFLSWSIYLIIKFPFLISLFISVVLAVLLFLYFNLKNKAFLGDGGNYFLSMLLGTVVIKLNNYQVNSIYAEEIFLLFLIPGVDMLRLFITRIKNKKNPFSGDRNHFHHYLLNKYGLQNSVLIYFIIINSPLYIYLLFNINLLFLIIANIFFYFLLIRKSVLKKI